MKEEKEKTLKIGNIAIPEGATIFLLVHAMDQQANEVYDKISEKIHDHDISLFIGDIGVVKKYGVKMCIEKDAESCVILEKDKETKRLKKYNKRKRRKIK